MRQLAPGALTVSPALQMADPAVIAQWAAATREGAHALSTAATRLAALCEAMPVGVWRSAAAGLFVHAGLEQARRLTGVAALFEQLASVAGGLAAALTAAQERARAAVAQGVRVDGDVCAFNGRLRAQHALRPQDRDSLLADGPEAQELQMRLAVCAGELADAEAAARMAWQRAAAGFDLVGYATPAMRQRMAAPGWDPAAQVRMAAAGAAAAGVTGCGAMEDLGLPVGGLLIGPDGRAYPLVVQTALDGEGKRLVTTRETADSGGWTPLAVRVGTTAYGPKATTAEKLAVFLGGAAGASYPEGTSFAPGLLGAVHVMPGGGAFLPPLARGDSDPVKEASAEAPRTYLDALLIAPRQGIAAGWKSEIPDGIGLAVNALSGVAAAHHLDDGRAAEYRVVFEENEQGALRARMELFRVLSVPDEQPRLIAEGGYVNARGHLAGVPATGESPQAPPIIIPAVG